jgi:hypothetical protein
MMADDKQKDPFMAISTALIALAALGVIIFTKVPLKGLRPATELREPTEQVRARLWQDPFAAVLEYLQAQPKGVASPEPELCPLTATQSLQIQESVKKGSLPQTIAARGKQETVTILGVMVFGGPYSEDTELRIRQRVAVLSALRRLGYDPEDAEHLNFLRIQTSDKPATGPILLSKILPYEWLQKNSGQQHDKVLLLWLNDDSFQPQPLARLHCLIKYLQSGDPSRQLPFKVIGPAGSSNLFNMINEIKSPAAGSQLPAGLFLYSPTATVSNALLLGEPGEEKTPQGRGEGREVEKQFGEDIQNLFRSRGIEFFRTISTDQQLAELLIDELQNRQVNLLLREIGSKEGHDHSRRDQKGHPFGGHKDHLVLIAEWDTFYGRSLPEIFVQVIRQEHNEGLNPGELSFLPSETPVNWVHRFSYLRGLDGVVPGSKDILRMQAMGSKNKDDAEKLIQEEPIGLSQFDYLRRLANRVYQLDRQLRQNNQGSIRAFGILGSDFYDKYLVLQALKQRFPEAIFFTTDLDARLMHEVYIDWTRNLVVASGFDLHLPAKIQGDVPPFRSSYQTSVFYAVLQAFCFAKATLPVCAAMAGQDLNKPRLFEIGRHGAVDLQKTSHLAVPLKKLIPFALLLLAFLWIISRGFRIRFSNRWRQVFLLAWVVVFLLLFYLFQHYILSKPGEEPLSLMEGVSVWPTDILRLVALCCSWFFFFTSVQNLRRSDRELAAEYDFRLFPRTNDSDRRHCYNLRWLWTSLLTKLRSSNEAPGRKFNANDLWAKYQWRSTLGLQVLRVIVIMVLYLPIARVVVDHFGRPYAPVRGNLSPVVDFWILFFTICSFLFLTFFIFDTTRLLRCFIMETLGRIPFWDPSSQKQFLGQHGRSAEEVDYWMLIHLVAQRSEVVSKLIFYPFIIWFILFFSRWSNFDNWRTPIGLAIVISLSAVFTWSCALTLRHAAEKLRTQIISRLSGELIRLNTAPAPDNTRLTRVRAVLEDVKLIRQGAFSPFFQNPIVQALFVPFGGVGGLTVLDFLNKIS